MTSGGILRINRCREWLAADRDMTNATGGATDIKHLWLWCSLSRPEGRGEPMLGGELRREERLLSRTRVCVDQIGAFDDMSEGFFRMPFPPSSGTTGVAHGPWSGMPNSTITS
jgi:hypothetical protein